MHHTLLAARVLLCAPISVVFQQFYVKVLNNNNSKIKSFNDGHGLVFLHDVFMAIKHSRVPTGTQHQNGESIDGLLGRLCVPLSSCSTCVCIGPKHFESETRFIDEALRLIAANA